MEKVSRLGRMLLDAKMITEEHLRMAVDFQKSVGGNLAAILVKLGFIEEQTLTTFIAKQQGLKVVNLDELVLPENLMKRIPRKLIERHHVLPIHYRNGVLTVATSDPYDYEAIGELQLAQDARIDINLAPRSQIIKWISRLFGAEDAAQKPPPPREEPERVSRSAMKDALMSVLIDKGIVTEEELARKARELEAQGSRGE